MKISMELISARMVSMVLSAMERKHLGSIWACWAALERRKCSEKRRIIRSVWIAPTRSSYQFAVMLVAVGIACGPAAISRPAAAQTLERIAVTRTVHIGYLPDQAPFSEAAGNNTPHGYSIDLCNLVVQKIQSTIPDLTVDYVQASMADAFGSVESGRIDLLCGAITITLHRREKVDFSQPIFMTGMAALLRSDAPHDLRELFLGEHEFSRPRSPSLRPFAISRVGVRAATTTEAVLRRTIAEGKYSTAIITYPTHIDGLAALEDRDIDAYFADRDLLIGLLAKARKRSNLLLGSRLFTHEPYGIAMQRGDTDLRLLTDRVLSELFATSQFETILRKYFGNEARVLQSLIQLQSIPE